MKAPDKIYTDGRNISQMPIFEEQVSFEYIRKDALLEWLIEGIETSERCHSEYGDTCAQVYQSVIDKINSL